MSDKKDSCSARRVPFIPIEWPGDEVRMPEDRWQDGWEWHLTFPYTPDLPCPFPIVRAGTRPKHAAVGHLASDGTVHVFNTGIIEKLVRAELLQKLV